MCNVVETQGLAHGYKRDGDVSVSMQCGGKRMNGEVGTLSLRVVACWHMCTFIGMQDRKQWKQRGKGVYAARSKIHN